MASKKKPANPHQVSIVHQDFTKNVYFKPHESLLPKVDWKPPRPSELPEWTNAKRISIDFETKDPEIRKLGPGVRREGNRVVGIAFAIEDGPEHYLPISHEGGDNCDWDVWGYFNSQIKKFGGQIVGNGITYDLDWALQCGMDKSVLRKPILDVQVIDVLLNELYDKYNLDALCERHGLPGKDETILREAAAAYRIDPKQELWKLPARFVAKYGMIDARRPLQLLRRQESELARQDSEDELAPGQNGIANMWHIESRVTPILVKMRRRGIRVDVDKLDRVEHQALDVEKEELAKVQHATGVRLGVGDVWKADALGEALQRAGYTPDKTSQGHWSVDRGFLDKCGDVGKWIKRAREWNKLRTTFVRQVRDHLIYHGPDHYRVHCTFHQLRSNQAEGDGDGRGVRYGRFSSTDFNIQQQPTRHEEFGTLWRSVFIADQGKKWGCSDWSQQEPRIAVHYAELLGLPGAKDFADEYRRNPKLDIHSQLAKISGMARVIVKNYVNGSLYGMGDAKLCKAIKCETVWVEKSWKGTRKMVEVPGPEGQAKIDEFYKFAPWIKGLTRAAAKRAEQRGYVRTRAGRKCRFVKGPDGRIDRAHKAFNRIGQGEAADQMKQTLIAVDEAHEDLIQAVVHDEYDYSFDDIKVARDVKEMQMHTITFNVPMNCDLEIGDNWGEMVKDEG